MRTTTIGCLAFAAAVSVTSSRAALSAPQVLPGDSAPAQAAGVQEAPEISRGGNGYLVVWADNRSSLAGSGSSGPYFGVGLGTMYDIYAARLDAGGNLVDATPIILSRAQYNQTAPRVGWNGQNWLVAWMTEREGDRYYNDVVGVRVSPGGAVLDSEPILINAAATTISWHTPWSVGSDGTNWVVTWRDLDETGSIFTIEGARIAPGGTLLDPGGKTLRQDSWNSGANKATLAFAGDEYLMTWLELDAATATWVVRGQRLTPALAPMGGVFKINLYAPTEPERPAIATDGTGFLVTWSEERYDGWSQLFGSRVSHTGTVLDPGGIAITASAGYTMFDPSVIWDGTSYFVTYNIQKTFGDDDIYVTRVSSSGTVLDPGGLPVRTGAGAQYAPAATRGISGGVQVVWNDATFAGDVQSAPVSAGGSAGIATDVSLGAPRHSLPRFAYSGPDTIVVYRSEVSMESRIVAQRLDAGGAAIDAEPIRVASGPGLTNPSVAWNGSNYLVIWENALEGRGRIYGRRLAANGTFLDAAPLPIMYGRMPDLAALGGNYLVVAADTDYDPHFRYTFAVRVDTSGNVLGAPARIGANFDVWPRVVAFGSRWLAVWEQNVTHDNVRSSIVGAFIGADGVSQGRFTLSDSGFDDRPHLAVSGDRALVAWEDGDVFGRRIGSDGTLLDTARGIVIAGGAQPQFRVSVASDGPRWIVAYLDHRLDPYPNQQRGDVFATRVDADGTVLDPDGFAVADTVAPEETPAVTVSGGLQLFAYAGFVVQAPYANLRMTVRSSDPMGAALGGLGGLILAKNGTDLVLTWGPCCLAGADYAIYEGSLGSWSGHLPDVCSTGGLTSGTVTPASGDRYFLVVPHDAAVEGSYGLDSTGAERAASTEACRSVQNTASCP